MEREEILKNNRAKELRVKHGYSLKKLQEKIYEDKGPVISTSALHNFETRKTVLWELAREKMASLYGVSIDYLDGADL
ncbi:helix-turn-helix domain-containing protein [Enterococcus diestrammenae]|uniref:helix-turn-helix domain-containing protein n=1 Tax=Enterococcus diestrammenae TaxID=1155073 RepID=UPI00195C69B0